MGKFVVSDSDSDEVFSYARDGSDEAQSSHRSVNNNEVSSSSSSDRSSDDEGTRAQRVQTGGAAVEVTEESEEDSAARRSEEESGSTEVDFLSVRGFGEEMAARVRLTYELPMDNYHVEDEGPLESVPLYREAGRGTGPDAIASVYTGVDLYNRAVKFYFSKRMQPLLPGWGVHTPSLYDRVPLIAGQRFALYTTCLSYGLRFPLTPFQKAFLEFHHISPSLLPPNSWRILTAFEAVCCTLVIRPTPTLFAHFYCFKRVGGWWYLTARPSTPKVFGNLAESVRGWKEKYVVISSDTGFGFPTVYSEPARKDPVALMEYDALGWQELHTFMDSRGWAPLNAQEIVKRWCSGLPAFDEEGTTSTSSPTCRPCPPSSACLIVEETINVLLDFC
mgnify:CR=1 FL=1